MSIFRSEDDIATWLRTTGVPRGVTLSLQQVWQLAQAWYGNRMDPTYRGRTLAEAEAVFASVGLVGEFWRG
jgi:hypothetical protein